MGALNAVEIAAATPQPTQVVTVVPACRFSRATSEPKVAPRWVSGPYWPTDAPAAEGHQACQGGEETGAKRDPAVRTLDRTNDVGGAERTVLWIVAVRDADDEPARGRHDDRREQQQPRILLHEAAARGDEEPLVEEEDEVHEPDGGERREYSRHHTEDGAAYDSCGRVRFRVHPGITSSRSPVSLVSPFSGTIALASGIGAKGGIRTPTGCPTGT